jgi:hypothetical protein
MDHVVVGGRLLEQAGIALDRLSAHQQVGIRLAENADKIGAAFERGVQFMCGHEIVGYNANQNYLANFGQDYAQRYSHHLVNSEHESTAYEKFSTGLENFKDHLKENLGENFYEGSKDAVLSAASLVAGDPQSAVEYGASAAEKLVKHYWEKVQQFTTEWTGVGTFGADK